MKMKTINKDNRILLAQSFQVGHFSKGNTLPHSPAEAFY